MAEELGKIQKPTVESFKKGRKLLFVPLLFESPSPADGYTDKFNHYWEQAEKQIEELVTKLGAVARVYHELVGESGETGSKAIEELNKKSHKIVSDFLKKKAELEALEDTDLLTEFMDWNRCLLIGLQNPNVITKVYDAYAETAKKRNEKISKKIDETLKPDEIGILLMRENHQVQFPKDIQIIYIAPPALDEIKRWIRDRERQSDEKK
ncbi:MAG TPA: hypothetical protein VMB24_02995 [Dehalococcoidales bacterium]|nr:hypothetical protein [Dehalococcoidales bacterium]